MMIFKQINELDRIWSGYFLKLSKYQAENLSKIIKKNWRSKKHIVSFSGFQDIAHFVTDAKMTFNNSLHFLEISKARYFSILRSTKKYERKDWTMKVAQEQLLTQSGTCASQISLAVKTAHEIELERFQPVRTHSSFCSISPNLVENFKPQIFREFYRRFRKILWDFNFNFKLSFFTYYNIPFNNQSLNRNIFNRNRNAFFVRTCWCVWYQNFFVRRNVHVFCVAIFY